ncbi:hypothetical protein JP31_04665 [Gallibacterium anatis]|uniref:alanine-zipper protein n=1 Tax=Gallibacterium anatis TaxID=750 RepID=UPI00053156A1|nr:alanine-zipper protein [Gallibacterium anatis]KGQ27269.1 hypothetical protein JP31_04665 [Gallibacterium anatis]
MADYKKPTIDSNYIDFVDELHQAINATATWNDGNNQNIPVGAKRWNDTSKIFEKYTGTQWIALSSRYNLPVYWGSIINKPVFDSSVTSTSTTTFATPKAVNTAFNKAAEGVTKANEAKTTADSARSIADTAKTTADSARSIADTAKTTADSARSIANTAKTTADSARSIADTAKTASNKTLRKRILFSGAKSNPSKSTITFNLNYDLTDRIVNVVYRFVSGDISQLYSEAFIATQYLVNLNNSSYLGSGFKIRPDKRSIDFTAPGVMYEISVIELG